MSRASPLDFGGFLGRSSRPTLDKKMHGGAGNPEKAIHRPSIGAIPRSVSGVALAFERRAMGMETG